MNKDERGKLREGYVECGCGECKKIVALVDRADELERALEQMRDEAEEVYCGPCSVQVQQDADAALNPKPVGEERG